MIEIECSCVPLTQKKKKEEQQQQPVLFSSPRLIQQPRLKNIDQEKQQLKQLLYQSLKSSRRGWIGRKKRRRGKRRIENRVKLAEVPPNCITIKIQPAPSSYPRLQPTKRLKPTTLKEYIAFFYHFPLLKSFFTKVSQESLNFVVTFIFS